MIFLTGMEEVDHCSNLLKNYSDTARDSKHGEDCWSRSVITQLLKV